MTEIPPGADDNARQRETSGNEASHDALRLGAGLAGAAALTLGGSGLGAALGMINEVLAAHFLGVETYGSYGLALAMAKIGEIVALFGVTLSVMHFLPVHLNRAEPELALGVVVGCLLLPVSIGVSFAMCAALCADWIAAHIFKLPQAASFIAILAVSVPLSSLSELFGTIARGFGHFLPIIFIRNLILPVCYMPLLIYLYVSSGPKIDAAYGYTGAAAVAATVGVIWAGKIVHRRIGLKRPAMQLWPLYRFSAPIALSAWLTILFYWVDLFLLAHMTDAKTVGVYRSCTQIVLISDLILTACLVATAPRFAVLFAKGDQHQLQEILTATTRIATILAAPLMLAITFNAREILGLFGADFELGRPALSILAFGQFVKVLFGSASIALIIGGRPTREASNMALAAGLNLALNLILIPRLGLVGAATATALSLLFLSGVRAAQLWVALKLRIADWMLVRIVLISAPIATLVWAASFAFGFGQRAGLLVVVFRMLVMGVLIAGGLWRFCLRRTDRAALIGAVLRHRPASAQSQLKS